MSGERNYPPRFSRITVTMTDGEVKEYDITAGCGLLPYLMRESADTGTLVILNGSEAYAIPMDKVSDVAMKEFATPEERAEFYAPKTGGKVK